MSCFDSKGRATDLLNLGELCCGAIWTQTMNHGGEQSPLALNAERAGFPALTSICRETHLRTLGRRKDRHQVGPGFIPDTGRQLLCGLIGKHRAFVGYAM